MNKLKNKWLNTTVIAILLAIPSGCASVASGPAFNTQTHSIPRNKAVVYIYREKSLADSGEVLNVSIDQRSVGKLRCNGYLEIALLPGNHTISMDQKFGLNTEKVHLSLPVTLMSGENEYFKLNVGPLVDSGTALANGLSILMTAAFGTERLAFRGYRLESVDENLALNEIQTLHQS